MNSTYTNYRKQHEYVSINIVKRIQWTNPPFPPFDPLACVPFQVNKCLEIRPHGHLRGEHGGGGDVSKRE